MCAKLLLEYEREHLSTYSVCVSVHSVCMYVHTHTHTKLLLEYEREHLSRLQRGVLNRLDVGGQLLHYISSY